MPASTVVWGSLLIVVGVVGAAWGSRAMLHRPGWDGRYGKGALVTLLGSFAALAGVLNLLIA